MSRPMTWHAIVREVRRKLRFDLRQQIEGWETFTPNVSGMPGGLLASKYRVRPIGWRKLLGRYDRELYR